MHEAAIGSRLRTWLGAAAAPTLMILAVIVVLAPLDLVRGDAALLGLDHHQLHAGRLRYAREALAAGDGVPAWYTRELLGAPFAANIQSFPWLPTRLALLALDPDLAFGPGVVLSAALAALFTFLFLRRIGASPLASAAAGWTFACAGFFASRIVQGHLPLLEAYPALPMLLWLVERLVAPEGAAAGPARGLVALGLASGCVALAGHPQLPAYAISAAAIYALARAPGRAGLRAVAALACGSVMALAAWWPCLLLVGRSTRLLDLPAPRLDNDVALPWGRLAAFVLPWADGWPHLVVRAPARPFGGYANEYVFWDTVAYVGWLPLLAALGLLVARAARGRPLGRPLAVVLALGAVAVVLALPWGPGGHGAWEVPSPLRSPARLLYVTTFALACALGRGVDEVRRALPRHAGLALAVALLTHALDLGLHARAFVRLVPPGRATYGQPLPPTDARVAVGADVLAALRVRPLDDVGAFDSILLARPYLALCALDGRAPVATEFLDGSTLSTSALRAAGARFVLTTAARPDLTLLRTDRTVHVYEVADAAPRASFRAWDRVDLASEEEALGRLAAALDAGRLLLGPEAVPWRPGATAPGAAAGSVAYRRPAPDRVEVDVTADGAGLVRVLESWDTGWTARVDGQPAPVLLADGFAMAVPVPAGARAVVLTYRTPGRRTGWVLGALGALALACLAATSAYPRGPDPR